MHRDVTLVAIKSSNKLKYLKLEERKLKTAKEVVIQFYSQTTRSVPISSSKLIWNFPNYFCNFEKPLKKVANPLKKVANLLMEFAMFLS